MLMCLTAGNNEERVTHDQQSGVRRAWRDRRTKMALGPATAVQIGPLESE